MSVSAEIIATGVERLLAGLDVLPEQLDAANHKALRVSALIVERAAKDRTPVRTGRLRSSIGSEVVGDVGRVGTNVKYAPFVEFGTRPHEIVPVRKQALFWPGALHPVRRVRHPGTAGRFYLRRGLEESRPQIDEAFRLAAKAVLDSLGG